MATTTKIEQSTDRASRLQRFQADVCQAAESTIVERMNLGVRKNTIPTTGDANPLNAISAEPSSTL